MLARQAMGYKSVQAIYLWPDVLPTPIADRVIGASIRIKAAAQPKRKTVAAMRAA